MTTTSETTRKYEVLNWANGTPTKAEFRDWDEALKYATSEAKANKEAGIAGAAAFNAIEIRTYEYTSESLGYLFGMEQDEPEQAEEPKDNEGEQAADNDADAEDDEWEAEQAAQIKNELEYEIATLKERIERKEKLGYFDGKRGEAMRRHYERKLEKAEALYAELFGDGEVEDEIAKAAQTVTDAGGVVVLPENAEAHDVRMRELHRAEDARNEALRKVIKLTDAIEDMKYDCDGEVYEALLAIADVLGR